jgi:hypothetical protein
MNKSFQLEMFQKAFQNVITFRESVLSSGGKKLVGKSALIQVELEEDAEGNLQRATMLFAFFLKDAESNRKITAHVFRFLDLCLPLTVMPPQWMEAATKKLKNTDEEDYETEQDGLRIALVQMKPELMFILSAERKPGP